MLKTLLLPIILIAFTDIALQLDNAIAISSVASGIPHEHRVVVLTGGVLLAALCLLTFTLLGAALIHRIGWVKPVAGLALIGIGAKLVLDYLG